MNYIQLDRKFSQLLSGTDSTSLSTDYSLSSQGFGEVKTWESLLSERSCVILAEAGAGKTKEFEECAKKLIQENKYSFFIRIEDIDSDFIDSFEVGDANSFEAWLSSANEEAWFFLDSVDEARLDDQRAFHKAIRKFSRKIKPGSLRCHVYISSRPYSWRFKEDEDYINSEFSFSLEDKSQICKFKVFTLSPLSYQEIEQFCKIRLVSNINNLINEIERFDLLALAERPFDLESIIKKWNDQGELGSRLDILQYNIEQRLKESHTLDRKSIPISFEKLIEGAQRLAAAVVLTRKSDIGVPVLQQTKDSLNASSILSEWSNNEISRLLESGIFNDIIYGAVRFRHRDICEFLAAKWFSKLLNADDRHSVENLFFREQFGEKIVVPTLRPILPWLILLDEKICQDVVKLQPEIAFESGDPSQLSIQIRKQLFSQFVERIAKNLDDRTVRDNDSIAKIANSDLEEEVLSLIQTYSENDDVIFFLGRMVWQGKFTKCISLLKPMALDSIRSMYSRRVSTRAIMACGTRAEKIELWTELNQSKETLDRTLIVEIIDEIEPDQEIIQLLICSLQKATPYKKYEYSGLNQTLDKFVQRCNAVLSYQLLLGIAELLKEKPFYEIEEYKVSKKHAWTFKTAFKIIKQLIENHSALTFEYTTMELLINVRALEYQDGYIDSEEKQKLKLLISGWDELNDKLYWTSIVTARKRYCEQGQESLTDDWRISCLGHFWEFDANSFDRLLKYIEIKELIDDKLIVLNRAYTVYIQHNKPDWMLARIQMSTLRYPVLFKHLTYLINPIKSEIQENFEKKEKIRKSRREIKQIRDTKSRLDWINSLKDNPYQLINSPHISKAELTNNHIWLMNELDSGKISTKRDAFFNWQALVPEFGEKVAQAYRDASIKFWRVYKPRLHSEETLERNSTSYGLIFGLAGLEIEFNEDPDFFSKLNYDEVQNTLRYISWDINGFPSWLEKFHQIFPDDVVAAVNQEIIWELESSHPEIEQYYNHILHDLFYHAPWLHNYISPKIFEWLKGNSKLLHMDTNRYALQILLNSDIAKENFSVLAQQKINELDLLEHKAWWYSLYVDSTPDLGICSLTNWLESLTNEDATYVSQVFISHLIGKRDAINGKAGNDEFKKIKYLKALYILMHKYIKLEDDMDRANTGVYSPGLRDDAQDSRDLLFKYLKEVPCAESYYAIKNLVKEHTDEKRQIWLLKTASSIALSCGDIKPWDPEQLLQFEVSKNINPKSHKELFDLALLRITALRDWLENGDYSPYQTWQRVEHETEMRNLIADELRKMANNKYSISQENELANSQRTDIRLDNPIVNNPVPIELKILDKGWSGSDLCERLRNQLVGDYLRERTAGCGIFLLISLSTNKNWKIQGNTISLTELERALQEYWYSIAHEWVGIDSIKIVVIDLNKRNLVSVT